MESSAKARKGRQQPPHAETQGVLDLAAGTPPEPAQDTTSARSEERRVGKECRL